jgi:hypothetical protein
MEEKDWAVLLGRIQDGRCTPFLGAGVNGGVLPGGADLAKQWSIRFRYPLPDQSDLSRVSQFLAVENDGTFPKEQIIKQLNVSRLTFSDALIQGKLQCLSAMASLPFHFFITTNYDDLLLRCLRDKEKSPIREFCRWNQQLLSTPSIFDLRIPMEPNENSPIVFHLHGNETDIRSLVLTEDDYLDFLMAISASKKIIPPRIQRALSDSSLLFVGYSLKDINFRVIHRSLVQQLQSNLRKMSVSVQLEHGDVASRSYLEKYFGSMSVKIYWGSAEQFASELLTRWKSEVALVHGI